MNAISLHQGQKNGLWGQWSIAGYSIVLRLFGFTRERKMLGLPWLLGFVTYKKENLFYLFILDTDISFYIFICLLLACWVFIALGGPSLVAVSGGHSLLGCTGFSSWWILLWSSWALQRGLNSCGTWAKLFLCMWNLSGPGIEPESSALAGWFLSTVPPGKS